MYYWIPPRHKIYYLAQNEIFFFYRCKDVSIELRIMKHRFSKCIYAIKSSYNLVSLIQDRTFELKTHLSEG